VTVKEIVKQYLIDNGFDGLYSYDCGCKVGDLMPCDGVGISCGPATCIPGYLRPGDDNADWYSTGYLILAGLVGVILGGLKLFSWYHSPGQKAKRARKKVDRARKMLRYSKENITRANNELYKILEELELSKHLSHPDDRGK